VASRQSLKALELCLKYNIKISEDMAEKLSSTEHLEVPFEAIQFYGDESKKLDQFHD
jgi:hypothetical protein